VSINHAAIASLFSNEISPQPLSETLRSSNVLADMAYYINAIKGRLSGIGTYLVRFSDRPSK